MKGSMTPSEISQALADRAECFVRELFPAGCRQGRDWCVGSLAGEPGRSLRIGLAGKHRGRWREYADGTHGDLLDLIAAAQFGGDLRRAISWARTWLGQEQVVSKRANSEPSKGQPARYETLSPYGRQIWSSCRCIDSKSMAALYLGARGCALPHPDGDLRWHPALKHPSGYVGPTLVALVADIQDPQRWLTLHRTWVAADGSGNKADVNPSRMLLKDHRKFGGCIRLWPDHCVSMGLAIGEGIETCLAAARQFTPIWSVIDAGNLRVFPVLEGVEALTIVTDHDPAGIGAALECGRRWQADGREVSALYPTAAGADWADVESGQ
jgi:Toprim domain-containing protein